MAPEVRLRPALVRSLDRALLAVAVAGVVLIVIQFALLPVHGPLWWAYAMLPVVSLVYLGAGLLAWRRRPSNPMGALILATGLALYLGALGNTDPPVLQAIGALCQTLVLAMMMHLLLAFPGGRLHSRTERVVMIAAYAAAVLLLAPQYLLNPHGSYPAFAVADLPGVAAAFRLVQGAIGGALMVIVAVILSGRLNRADAAHRRVLIPLYAYGIFAVLFVPFSSFVLERMLGVSPAVRGILQFVVVAGVPVAFVLGILRGGFARTGEVEELSTWLGSATVTKAPLGVALARALGDPSLLLVFWAAERERFVDSDGHPVPEPLPMPDRGVQSIVLDGRTIGAISYDATLLTDPDLVRTAGSVVAIAVERERLTAELLASSRALVRSRERIVEAADKERRRIARDLHDGIQVQLVMLGMEAQRIASAPPEAVGERATRLRRDVDAAAADLRNLVHDLVPAALIERGLFAAAEDLVDRMPIPTRLEPEGTSPPRSPLPEGVENTAYFVVAEGLANVVKHARAGSARVRIARDGDVLHVDVHDDGVGGATLESGSGLRGLADRVDAAGGSLTLTSVIGEGTHLWTRLPCAS